MLLSGADEFLFHQHPAALNVPAVSDVHFNDGYFFATLAGGTYISTGLRVHPNMNVMDGWAGIVADGEERAVRFSRALRPDFESMRLGPLFFQIVRPMEEVRVVLDESPIDLSFDLTFHSDGEPILEPPYRHYKHGHLINDVVRYSHHASATGSVVSQGKNIEVDSWLAVRDHSWGVRSAMGPKTPHGGGPRPPDEVDARRFRIWAHFEVAGVKGFFQTHEDEQGRPLDFAGRVELEDGTRLALTEAKHSLHYNPGTANFTSGQFQVRDEGGAWHDFEIAVEGTPVDLQAFGYHGGWRDGASAGVYRGTDLHVEHDTYAVDPMNGAQGPSHVPERARLGATEYPCTITDSSGAVGSAHFEHHLLGRFEPYLEASESKRR